MLLNTTSNTRSNTYFIFNLNNIKNQTFLSLVIFTIITCISEIFNTRIQVNLQIYLIYKIYC